jgi:hypothetical protein
MKTRTRRCLLLAAVWCYLVVNLKVALDVSMCQQPIHQPYYDVPPDLAVGLPTNDAVRPSLSLPWNEINLQLTVNATCIGAHNKCFYPSVSNPSVGYLIADEGAYASMYWETRMAARLQDEFGSKHFTPDFPYQVNLTNDLAQDLKNQVAIQPAKSASNASTPVLPGGGIHRNTSIVAVQKVRVPPHPSLFVALSGPNRQMAKVAKPLLEGFRPKIPDPEAFGRQFQLEITRILKVLDRYPHLLMYDFQGLVDLQGNFYHLDLEGQVPTEHMPLKQRILEKERVHNTLLNYLQTLTGSGGSGRV